MVHDPIADRFAKRQEQRKLQELARRARPKKDVEEEEKLLKETKKVDPIRAEPVPDRNAPCPCGSGRKYKKCCGKGQ